MVSQTMHTSGLSVLLQEQESESKLFWEPARFEGRLLCIHKIIRLMG